MLSRPFGATNKPDTCLWCGRRLPLYLLDRERVHGPWAKDGADLVEPAVPAGHRVVKRRVEDQPDFERRRVELHLAKEDARRGVHGDGLFCTRGCGEEFGRNAARYLGIRLKPIS